MHLSVPHPNPKPDLNGPCVPDPFGFWTCFEVPSYPVVKGDYLFTIAPRLNADPYKICEMNALPNCSLIHPGQILRVPQTECTETASYTCYTMPWDPTIPSSVLCNGATNCEPLLMSRTSIARGDTSLTTGHYESYFLNNSANNKFVTAFFNLNAAFRRNGHDWYSNMHVKIPKLSACTTADPNDCFTVTSTFAKQASDWSFCKKNHFSNCTWPDSDYALWLDQFTECSDNLVFSLSRANGMVYNWQTGLCNGGPNPRVGLQPGMQLRLPKPKLVPCDDEKNPCPGAGNCVFVSNIDYHGSDIGHIEGSSPPGCCAACTAFVGCSHWTWSDKTKTCWLKTSAAGAKPSTGATSGSVTVGGGRPSLTEECVDKPGPGGHWCYRMQQYVRSKSGDYLYNASQNVPSLPTPWKPWCASFKNCAMVLPLAAVPIPITGGHECNPSKTCNVCAACCQSYIPDGSKCDGCVASECK